MSTRDFSGFPDDALRFLRALRRNNRREWFTARRERFETSLSQPIRALIEEMDSHFATFAPEIVGDARTSVFRIHRDVRFSPDKSPYKTAVACWFFHRDAGRGVGKRNPHGGAGFYFHIEPDASLLAAGLWMPPGDALLGVRQALVADHASFARIVESPARARRFGSLSDEAMLRRVPRGFGAGHPAAKWLRHRSFTMSRTLSPDEVLSPRLPATLARDYRALLPLVRWLNSAIGFPPAERR